MIIDTWTSDQTVTTAGFTQVYEQTNEARCVHGINFFLSSKDMTIKVDDYTDSWEMNLNDLDSDFDFSQTKLNDWIKEYKNRTFMLQFPSGIPIQYYYRVSFKKNAGGDATVTSGYTVLGKI